MKKIEYVGPSFSVLSRQLFTNIFERNSLEDIKACIQAYIADTHLKEGQWLNAVGYDQNQLEGKKHPDRAFLDQICPDRPLILQHVSGRMGVLNSEALEALGLTEGQGLAQTEGVQLESGLFYADIKDADLIDASFAAMKNDHFKLGGYKIFLDGSPQGGTDHRQLLAHCNGDAACGQYLAALDVAAKTCPDLLETIRTLLQPRLKNQRVRKNYH